METMKPLQILKKYFEPPKIEMKELKDLSQEARYELVALAAKELNVEVEWPAGITPPSV